MFKETEQEHFDAVAYAIPLKAGGFAFLSACSIGSTYITKEERWYVISWGHHDKMKKYLSEFKSGKGNHIMKPGDYNSDMTWDDLDYANAKILERYTVVTKNHTYKNL